MVASGKFKHCYCNVIHLIDVFDRETCIKRADCACIYDIKFMQLSATFFFFTYTNVVHSSICIEFLNDDILFSSHSTNTSTSKIRRYSSVYL